MRYDPLWFLIVLDSGERPTAPNADLPSSVAATYLALRDRGVEVVIACDGGGFPAVAGDMRKLSDEPAIARILSDTMAWSDITDVLSFEQIVLDDFHGLILMPSAHAVAPDAEALIAKFLGLGRLVVLPPGFQIPSGHEHHVIVKPSPRDLGWISLLD